MRAPFARSVVGALVLGLGLTFAAGIAEAGQEPLPDVLSGTWRGSVTDGTFSFPVVVKMTQQDRLFTGTFEVSGGFQEAPIDGAITLQTNTLAYLQMFLPEEEGGQCIDYVVTALVKVDLTKGRMMGSFSGVDDDCEQLVISFNLQRIVSDVLMAVDSPQPGNVSKPFTVSGWAIDRGAASGTGIDAVHVWAFPTAGGAPTFLGVPVFFDRPDVAAVYGSRFLHSGYSLNVSALAPGTYDIAVFPHSSFTGQFAPATVIRITVQ